jgi:hypothetical protein
MAGRPRRDGAGSPGPGRAMAGGARRATDAMSRGRRRRRGVRRGRGGSRGSPRGRDDGTGGRRFRAAGELGGGDESREGGLEEREQGFGGEAADGWVPRGGGGSGLTAARTARVVGAVGKAAGPPGERAAGASWAAGDGAGQLGRAPGWAARGGGGERRKKGFFPFLIYFLNE